MDKELTIWELLDEQLTEKQMAYILKVLLASGRVTENNIRQAAKLAEDLAIFT